MDSNPAASATTASQAPAASVISSQKVKDTVDTSKIQVEFNQFLADVSGGQPDKTAAGGDKAELATREVVRLVEKEYVNPYDVLEIGFEAGDVEIKARFRLLSKLVHPDKCKHEKAKEAFHVLDKAYKTLMDVDKRRTYQRVMREARESVEASRKKENDRRLLLDLPPLPESTLHVEIQETCKRLFEKLEEKKKNFERLDKAYKEQ